MASPVKLSNANPPTALPLQLIEQIGRGTYGTVWKAFDVDDRLVALKRLAMDKETDGFPITSVREVKVLQCVQHPNIIRLESCHTSMDGHLYRPGACVDLVFPYMEHDLAGILEQQSIQLSPSLIKYYLHEILVGLRYLHANHVMHRDIKASNILINNNGSVRIADFGLARFTDVRCQEYTNRVVTMWYRPPELFLGAQAYDYSIDMWSVGCIMAEMLTKVHPFAGTSELDTLDRIFRLCGTPDPVSWPGFTQMPWYSSLKPRKPRTRQFENVYKELPADALSLLQGLLCLDPNQRLTAQSALKHEYFRATPFPIRRTEHPRFPHSHEFKCRQLRALRKHRRDPNSYQGAMAMTELDSARKVASPRVKVSPAAVQVGPSPDRRRRSRFGPIGIGDNDKSQQLKISESNFAQCFADTKEHCFRDRTQTHDYGDSRSAHHFDGRHTTQRRDDSRASRRYEKRVDRHLEIKPAFNHRKRDSFPDFSGHCDEDFLRQHPRHPERSTRDDRLVESSLQQRSRSHRSSDSGSRSGSRDLDEDRYTSSDKFFREAKYHNHKQLRRRISYDSDEKNKYSDRYQPSVRQKR